MPIVAPTLEHSEREYAKAGPYVSAWHDVTKHWNRACTWTLGKNVMRKGERRVTYSLGGDAPTESIHTGNMMAHETVDAAKSTI